MPFLYKEKMAKHRLTIMSVTSSQCFSFEQNVKGSVTTRMREMQAKFERLWLLDPERFNPLRHCMQRECLERSWQLLIKHMNLVYKQVVDIGCGAGVFSRRLRDAGAHVEALDIAENALKHFRKIDADHIHLKQGAIPITPLPDHAYDGIICTELIAELPQEDYRLFFAELARLIKTSGYLICSSSIDIDSVGGVERLLKLAQTEFNILDATASYHALYLRLKRFLTVPSRWIQAWKSPEIKSKEIAARQGFNRWWFWLNTTPLLIWLWYACEPCTRPILKIFKNNRNLLLRLEKICRFIWDQEGISHYVFIAKRRPLEIIEPQQIPLEKPRRKEIWN